MASAEEENRRLFVGGLNGVTTDATFRAHFARFFPVANAEVSKTEFKSKFTQIKLFSISLAIYLDQNFYHIFDNFEPII